LFVQPSEGCRLLRWEGTDFRVQTSEASRLTPDCGTQSDPAASSAGLVCAAPPARVCFVFVDSLVRPAGLLRDGVRVAIHSTSNSTHTHTDSVASHSQLSRCIAHRGSDRYSMRSTRPARRHRTSHVAGTGHSVTLHSRDVTEAQDGRSARYSILYLWRRSEGHMISHGTSTPRKHGLFTCERVPPSGNERTELLLLCV
jgi:hypothetical protein